MVVECASVFFKVGLSLLNADRYREEPILAKKQEIGIGLSSGSKRLKCVFYASRVCE